MGDYSTQFHMYVWLLNKPKLPCMIDIQTNILPTFTYICHSAPGSAGFWHPQEGITQGVLGTVQKKWDLAENRHNGVELYFPKFCFPLGLENMIFLKWDDNNTYDLCPTGQSINPFERCQILVSINEDDLSSMKKHVLAYLF